MATGGLDAGWACRLVATPRTRARIEQKAMRVGETMQIGSYTVLLQGVDTKPERNYTAQRLLVEVLRDCKDEFITIEFDSRRGETPVFSRAEMLAATDEILNDNGVRSQGSPDMLAIWNLKGPELTAQP